LIIDEDSWSATSNIFKKYFDIVSIIETSLKYRRISDLLVELENTGILVSRAYLRGRNGYGKEYKLKVDPSLVGPSVDENFYDSLVKRKTIMEQSKSLKKIVNSLGRSRHGKYRGLII
jgi:hypothetical protein